MPIKTHQDEKPTLNMTPMIDILFLLIIFFMVGTKFTEIERKIDLEVPEVSDTQTPETPPQHTIINVFRDGSVTLGEEQMDLKQLESRLASLRQQSSSLSVIIRGDAEGAFQNVASVLSVCRQAGVSDLGVSVRMARKDE
jgi:biopolymer transport protein ExbD